MASLPDRVNDLERWKDDHDRLQPRILKMVTDNRASLINIEAVLVTLVADMGLIKQHLGINGYKDGG